MAEAHGGSDQMDATASTVRTGLNPQDVSGGVEYLCVTVLTQGRGVLEQLKRSADLVAVPLDGDGAAGAAAAFLRTLALADPALDADAIARGFTGA
jgi:hypothetical protein